MAPVASDVNPRNWLVNPLFRHLDLDDPMVPQRRAQTLRANRFLHLVYEEWYQAVASAIPAGPGKILELGSGGGFLDDYVPELVASDVISAPGIHAVLDGQRLPFSDSSLHAVAMVNVFHHLPRPERFLAEATRCVRVGGVLTMLEPWVTPWSRLIYRHLHHEPFRPDAPRWEFPATGPFSGANGALAWLVFERDRARLEKLFPGWELISIRPLMPFRYLISGGFSHRSLAPVKTYRFWRWLESVLDPGMKYLAMFALIVLSRVDVRHG